MSPTQRGVVLDHVVLDYMVLDPMVLDPMVLVRVARDRIVLERVVLDGLSYVIAGAVLPRTIADLFWPCTASDSLGERARGRGSVLLADASIGSRPV
jgi:hypothetical protein